MNAKFTPGPWVYKNGAVYNMKEILIGEADRDYSPIPPWQRDLNVILMALSPEMYECLKGLIASLHGPMDEIAPHIAKANEIFKKIEGSNE